MPLRVCGPLGAIPPTLGPPTTVWSSAQPANRCQRAGAPETSRPARLRARPVTSSCMEAKPVWGGGGRHQANVEIEQLGSGGNDDGGDLVVDAVRPATGADRFGPVAARARARARVQVRASCLVVGAHDRLLTISDRPLNNRSTIAVPADDGGLNLGPTTPARGQFPPSMGPGLS